MFYVNALLRGLFDGLLYPFRSLPPLVGLAVLSLLTAIGMLLGYKVTSNQEGLAQVKRRIHAALFEMRLFNDDLRAVLRAQVDILRHNLRYLGLAAVPMLWMIVPLVLVVGQLHFHYAYRGLEPGERALVKVAMVEAVPAESENGEASDSNEKENQRINWAEPVELPPKPDVRLEVPSGLRVETPALWIPSTGEVNWRIAAVEPGDYEMRIVADAMAFTKEVSVAGPIARHSPVRPGAGFLDQLLYPAEASLPKTGPIASITLTYPDATVSVLGFELHWMIVYFVLSIVFALFLRDWLKVTI